MRDFLRRHQSPMDRWRELPPALQRLFQRLAELKLSMTGCHLIRVGAMGLVGRFVSVDALRYPRRSRVIVRTPRGVEIGHVLAAPDDTGSTEGADGQILRGMTTEDALLAARLDQRRQDAFAACAEALAERGIAATLIDVEHLFDGRGLFFYFLGDTPPELDAFTAELANAYDAKAEVRRFSETLSLGCGPDCGTEAAEGAGCLSCTGCAVSSACQKPVSD